MYRRSKGESSGSGMQQGFWLRHYRCRGEFRIISSLFSMLHLPLSARRLKKLNSVLPGVNWSFLNSTIRKYDFVEFSYLILFPLFSLISGSGDFSQTGWDLRFDRAFGAWQTEDRVVRPPSQLPAQLDDAWQSSGRRQTQRTRCRQAIQGHLPRRKLHATARVVEAAAKGAPAETKRTSRKVPTDLIIDLLFGRWPVVFRICSNLSV